MKYYLYISDAKVDMLLPQVPHAAKKKIASEIGFDFKLLKGSRKTETEWEESRIGRLEAVVSFIREYGTIGSVDEPDDFVADTQLMQFGADEKGIIAYFTGRTERTVFAMAGSARHLISADPTRKEWPLTSSLNDIVTWLRQKSEGVSVSEGSAVRNICAQVGILQSQMPNQRLEFVAKRLLWKTEYKCPRARGATQVLLATPLYIAMTD